MLEELEEQLVRIRSRLAERDRIRSLHRRAREAHRLLGKDVERLAKVVQGEERDVAKLEGLSLTALFATILGDKKEKVRAEQKELLAAKLKHDEALAQALAIEEEVHEYDRQLEGLEECEAEYEALLGRKEDWLRETGHPELEILMQLAEEKGARQDEIREILGARSAGNLAKSALGRCQRALGRARGWGTFDMMGGGLLTTMAKHSHIDKARHAARDAQRALSKFQRELADVSERRDLTVQVGSIGSFADYFFDSLIVDWMVQSRIHEAGRNVDRTSRQVDQALRDLENRASANKTRILELEAERKRRIEEVR